MPFQDATVVVQLTMSFDNFQRGWQEKLFFAGPNDSNLMTLVQSGISYRVRCLPANCRLKYARLSTMGKPRGAIRVKGVYPKDGTWTGPDTVVGTVAQNSAVNDTKNAIGLRFEDGAENWATRFMHGIPDAQVLDETIVDSIQAGDTTPAALPDPDTVTVWGTRVGEYLKWVKTNSVMHRSRVINQTTVHQIAVPVIVMSTGWTSHKTGRPFGISPGHAPIR